MSEIMDSLYTKLAEILEVDKVNPEDVLQDFDNWDSLTILSILATLDASFGVNLTASDLREVRTAGELVAQVESRKRR